MNINDMKQSKYLKKQDIGSGKLVTINRIGKDNLAKENQPPEIKAILFFNEIVAEDGENKGLVMNWTNLQLCASACGSEETDQWPGKQIVLYFDPNVSYGGNLIGGIRIRGPRQQAGPPQTGQSPAQAEQNPYVQSSAPVPTNDFDDDLPW